MSSAANPLASLFGGIGGLFGALGGNARNTDRKEQLSGYGDLANVFNFGMNQGKAGVGAGMGTEAGALEQLGGPASYYQKLLSGNRASAMSAVAPTVNAVNSQTDAAARQASASGTARGGGGNAQQQQIDTTKQGLVENAITGAREGAAGGAADVAGKVAGIGGTQLSAALNLLGLGEHAAATLTDEANRSRETSQALHNQQAQQMGQSLAAILFPPST